MVWTVSRAPAEITVDTMTCVFRVVADGAGRATRHRHPELHQLTWCPADAVTVQVEDGTWTVPPSLAFWVPAGHLHALRGVARATECLDLKVHRSFLEQTSAAPTPVEATPLVRALLEHLADPGLDPVARRRAELVLLDRLRPARVPGTHVPTPADPRLRGVVERLLADPGDPRGLRHWAELARVSPRTLERLVRDGTGTSFRTWRTRLRMSTAVAHLAAGHPVSIAGRKVGYSHAGAFAESFQRQLGLSPSRYRARFLSGPLPAGDPVMRPGRRATAFPPTG